MGVLVMTVAETGKIIVYNPVCPQCKKDMVYADGNAVGEGYSDQTNAIITKLIFACREHPQYREHLTNEQLAMINTYPNTKQEIRSWNTISKRNKRSHKREQQQ